MSKKATDILAYLGPIGYIIAFAFTKDRKASKLALDQGLVLVVLTIICSGLQQLLGGMAIIGNIVNVVVCVVDAAVFIFSIWGIVNAVKGEDKPLPIIGSIISK